MSRGCKGVSKYMSLSDLEYIRDNHYISKGGINYEAEEVDELIYAKQTLKDDRENEILINNMEMREC